MPLIATPFPNVVARNPVLRWESPLASDDKATDAVLT